MGERREKLSRKRMLVRNNLMKSAQEIPQVTGFVQLNCTPMLKFQETMKEKGEKISTTVLLIKAIAMAMADYPQLNTRMEGDEVIYYDSINAGVGVQTPKGLIVTVVKELQDKSILEVSHDFQALMGRVKTNKLTMDDLTGSTFTVSNLSKVTRPGAFTSIINNSETCIIGLSGITRQPIVASDGSIVVQDCANLITNVNHIIVDGMTVTQFRNRVCDILEQPEPSFKI